ncbi:MAG: response regulator [Planctomycetota bacterium]
MTGQTQILIADDDPDLLDLLVLRCRAMGLDVITACDAMDALANADFYAPEIALLDVRMPGGNGISVSEMLATDERLRRTQVIVITADANETIEARCNEIGAQLVAKDSHIWGRLETLLGELIEGAEQSMDDSDSDLKGRVSTGSHSMLGDSAVGDSMQDDSMGSGSIRGGIDALTQASAAPESPSAFSMFDEWSWVDDVGQVPAPAARLKDDAALPWVLAIDADPDFSIGLQGSLVDAGVRLVRAFRGSEGCRAIFKGCPEAILLHDDLPDANGEYILRRLRETPMMESVPIIVTSDRDDASVKRRIIAAGASDFLVKPLSWERIKRALVDYTNIDFRSLAKRTPDSMSELPSS